eukprot:CAMPEP_0178512600 /NCGR_PEP_ID=MMETSP0696-20121128/22984_1 /TAXON_ID=265572 /ORGANISM="Extubocellulus spinifer, Strain CCMP396" /LENGTH=676 /DNA_ID=CAMNT_0020142455 /DNA_START=63 /DNA_END=2093 /DNA_ORIENTATION=+
MAHPKPASPNEPRSSTDPPPTDGGKMRDEGSSSSTTSTAGAPGATGSAVASPSSPAAVNAATSPSPENATESFATRTEDTTGEEQQPKREDEEVPPSYETTRSSPIYYSQPKSLLNEGRFEEALQLIESTMIELRSRIARGGGSEEKGQGEEAGAAADDDDDADNECHEALAPLYYLYGTTLLYSVEESDDMMNNNQQATGEGGMPSEEMAEDIQIAWENLDLARSIMVDRVVGEDDIKALIVAAENCDGKSNSNDVDPQDQEQQDELKAKVLDLAQIHLRLADLQKANGAYSDALSDYKRALYLRRVALGTEFDRRVADVCYSLGITSMMLAAEGDRAADGDADAAAGGAADGAGAATSTGLLPPGAEDGILGMMGAAAQEAVAASKPTPEQCRRLRERSVMHYLDCGRAFGGCIALLCGVDRPEDVVGEGKTIVAVEEEEDEDEDEDKKPSAAEAASSATKTVDDKRHEHQAYVTASKTLADIRSKCSDLANSKPSAASASSSDAAQSGDDNNKNNNNEAVITDLLELLDELQETIDSQEQDMGGIQEVHEMKTRIEEEVTRAADDPFGVAATATATANVATTDASGATTTIGFGAAPAAPAASAATATAAANTTATASAKPMMVIKKKKKRAALTTVAGATDAAAAAAKPAAASAAPATAPSAEPDAKRAKTE